MPLKLKGKPLIVPPPKNRPGCNWGIWFGIEGRNGSRVAYADTRGSLRAAMKNLLDQIEETDRLGITTPFFAEEIQRMGLE